MANSDSGIALKRVGGLITNSVERHYGFPRLVRAQNGELLLFYRIGTTHAYDDSAIAMRRSSDRGCPGPASAFSGSARRAIAPIIPSVLLVRRGE